MKGKGSIGAFLVMLGGTLECGAWGQAATPPDAQTAQPAPASPAGQATAPAAPAGSGPQTSAPSSGLASQGEASPRSLGPVRVERFGHLRWSPETNALHSQGPVRITYTDPATKIDTVLDASDLDYDAAAARVRARGTARVSRPEGRFEGSNIDFDLRANVGKIENAVVVSDYFRMSGDLIEQRADGTYRLTNGDFTTCIHGQPDYRLHAKDFTVKPASFVKAHNVQVFLGHFALPAIPYISRTLGTGGGFPIPTPGYNKTDGFSIRLQDSPLDRKNETVDYDVRVNFRRAPTGFVVFQHDIGSTPFQARPPRLLLPALGNPLSGLLELITPPTYREYVESHYSEISEPRNTFFATLQTRQFVYNRRRTDLEVSRYPEVGVQFLNVLGRPFRPQGSEDTGASAAPDPRIEGVGAAARYRTPNAPALLNITAGVGEFVENPTKVSAGRLGIRANLASQPLLLGKRLSARVGVSEFFNVYTKGTAYQLLAPEAELDFVPTRTSLFNIGYRYLTDTGNTPFAFDRRDIRHELRLQYQVSGPWAFGVVSKIDLERSRGYDTEFAIVRNFDCMQVGLVYRTRSQSFNILFSLLPPRRDKSRPLVPLRSRP